MIGLEIGWLVLVGAVELFVSQWPRLVSRQRRQARNLAFTVVNHIAMPPLSLLFVHWLAPLSPGDWFAALPIFIGIPLAIVVFDFVEYWFHRISHRSLFLWRFHQIHHLDEDFDFTTGARFHPVQLVLQVASWVAVAAVLGIPTIYLTIFLTMVSCLTILHHANIAIPWSVEKWLRMLIITPALHVAHHHDQIQDTDSNYGVILPWWDHLFGTYNRRSRTAEWRIGLDYSGDLGFARLVVQPFIPTQLKEYGQPPHPYPGADQEVRR
jgi:sterol desaturase/sphingolipid hydroxylase (fatty acid hydroxylase superfamily)